MKLLRAKELTIIKNLARARIKRAQFDCVVAGEGARGHTGFTPACAGRFRARGAWLVRSRLPNPLGTSFAECPTTNVLWQPAPPRQWGATFAHALRLTTKRVPLCAGVQPRGRDRRLPRWSAILRPLGATGDRGESHLVWGGWLSAKGSPSGSRCRRLRPGNSSSYFPGRFGPAGCVFRGRTQRNRDPPGIGEKLFPWRRILPV